MSDLILHPLVASYPSLLRRHGVFIVYGSAGIGKTRFIHSVFANNWDKIVITPNEKAVITVEMIKELVPKLQFKATSLSLAVIVDEAEKLTHQAQNAFLKTLEELPLNLSVILIVDHLNMLLPTIRSRSQTFFMPVPRREDILSWLVDIGHDQAQATELLMRNGPCPARLANIAKDSGGSVEARLTDFFGGALYRRLQISRQLQSEQLGNLLPVMLSYVREQLRSQTALRQWLNYQTAILAVIQMQRQHLNNRFILDYVALAGEHSG